MIQFKLGGFLSLKLSKTIQNKSKTRSQVSQLSHSTFSLFIESKPVALHFAQNRLFVFIIIKSRSKIKILAVIRKL